MYQEYEAYSLNQSFQYQILHIQIMCLKYVTIKCVKLIYNAALLEITRLLEESVTTC